VSIVDIASVSRIFMSFPCSLFYYTDLNAPVSLFPFLCISFQTSFQTSTRFKIGGLELIQTRKNIDIEEKLTG
jgi:hypothetical protein